MKTRGGVALKGDLRAVDGHAQGAQSEESAFICISRPAGDKMHSSNSKPSACSHFNMPLLDYESL